MSTGRTSANKNALRVNAPFGSMVTDQPDGTLHIRQPGGIAVGSHAVVYDKRMKSLLLVKLRNRFSLVGCPPGISAAGQHHHSRCRCLILRTVECHAVGSIGIGQIFRNRCVPKSNPFCHMESPLYSVDFSKPHFQVCCNTQYSTIIMQTGEPLRMIP